MPLREKVQVPPEPRLTGDNYTHYSGRKPWPPVK